MGWGAARRCSASSLRCSPTFGDAQVTSKEKMRDGRTQVGVPDPVVGLGWQMQGL